LSVIEGRRGKVKISFLAGDVKSIAIFGRSPVELEVRTEKEVFIGTLQEPVDVVVVSEVLQAVFGIRFLQV
jgi:hypothetical protein